MNAIFGHGGWSSQITMQRNILNEKDDRGRWNVGYITSIRVTLLNGASHEDCGSGEGIDNSKIKAHEKAIKSAITDGMKRAARHFGERLGNALYIKGSGIRTAPKTNREALLELERKDSLNLFGDQAVLRENHLHSPDETQSSIDASTTASSSTISASTNNEVRNDNWQQNRIGSTMNHVANLCNPRPSSNLATGGQQILQQQQTGLTGISVLPSPIPSSTGTHGSSSYSHVASLSTQVNNHLLPHTTSTSIAPRPPLLTAPPTRPIIYNPGVMGGHVNGNEKRGVDGIENQYLMNNSNTNNVNGYSNGDNSKRMRANPYNSKTDGSNRLSV
jgi:DNA recombination protein Rad52